MTAVNYLILNRIGTPVASANTPDLAHRTMLRIAAERGWKGLQVVRETTIVRRTVLAEMPA